MFGHHLSATFLQQPFCLWISYDDNVGELFSAGNPLTETVFIFYFYRLYKFYYTCYLFTAHARRWAQDNRLQQPRQVRDRVLRRLMCTQLTEKHVQSYW